MKILTVVPLARGVFKEDLTYFSAQDVPNGAIVDIPVRNKKILGLVVSSQDASAAKSDIKDMPFNLKKISAVKEQSIFSKEFLESAFQIGKYFAVKKNEIVTSLIPTIMRDEYDEFSKIKVKKLNHTDINLKPEKLLFQAPNEDRFAYYKTMIRSSFAEKKSIFMVLPTERDIELFSEFLSKGIEPFAFSIHGGLSAKNQIKKIKEIITIEHPVIIFATALFLSIPRNDFGTIIIEHESSSAYKTMARPYLDMRSFAELFASKIGAKLILSDSLLHFETIGRKELDYFNEIQLSFRIKFDGEIEIPAKEKKFRILSKESVEEIENTLKQKKNVFIFSLRKGLATMTICRDCNVPIMCENCMAPVVLYLSKDKTKRMFVCNHCNTEKNPEMLCKNCGSWNLMPLGIGTDTVFEEAEKLFPQNKIFKLDRESAKTAKGAEKIIKDWEDNQGGILVGTEMAFQYIENEVPLSIIASFDSLWSIPNYKMGEKIIGLLISILSKTNKKLIIQTKNEKDPTLLAIKNENLLSFVRQELEDRKKLEYPPYKRFIKISHFGEKQDSIIAKKYLTEAFAEYNPEIFSGFVSREKAKYVANALIKIPREKWSLPEFSANSSIDQNLLSKLLSLPMDFHIHVDPEDLL